MRFFVCVLFENIREWLAINSCVLTFLQQITFHTIYFYGCCIILVASVGCSFFSTFHISKLKQGFCYRPFPSTFLLNSSFPVYFLLRVPCIYRSLSRTFWFLTIILMSVIRRVVHVCFLCALFSITFIRPIQNEYVSHDIANKMSIKIHVTRKQSGKSTH